MARVAVAYVEVRPDFKGFREQLKGQVEATTLRVAKSVNSKVEAAQATHNAKMQAINDKMAKAEVDTLLAAERDGLQQKLALSRDSRKLATAEADRQVRDEKAALIERNKFTAAANAELVARYKQMVDEELKDDTAGSAKRRTAARAAQAEQIAVRRQTITENFRQSRVAAKLEESLAATEARNTQKIRLRFENETTRQRLLDERASSTLVARHSAEDFAAEYGKQFRSRFRTISKNESREFERTMTARFGAIGGQVAKRSLRDFDKAGKVAGKRFGDSFFEQAKLGINLKLGRLGAILGLVAATAAPLANVISSLAAGVSALAVAAGHAAAAVGIGFVTALGAVVQAGGVARFAVEGMTDALKAMTNIQQKNAAGIALTQGDLNNYAEAMARLSPAARDVAGALGQVSGQFVTIRKSLQQKLFAGVAGQIQTLASTYLPMLNTQFGATATVLNKVGAGLAAYAAKSSTVDRVNAIMSGNTGIITTLGKAMVPLVDTVLRLWQAFQPLGQALAQYVSAWAEANNKTVAASEQSGSLAETVRRLTDAMLQMFRIAGNVFGALKSTFSALLGPGQTMLTMFENLTAKWKTWSSSIIGQNAISQWATDAIPVLSAIGRLVGDVFRMFNNLAKAGDAATFIDQIRAILPPLEQLLGQLSASNAAGEFAKALSAVGQAFADMNAGGALANMITLIGELLTHIINFITWTGVGKTIVGSFINVLLVLAALRFVATITGLVGIAKAVIGLVGLTTEVKAFTAAVKGAEAVGTAGIFGAAIRTGALAASGAVKGLVLDLRIARATMLAGEGAASALAIGISGVTAAIAANPVGAIIVGVSAVAIAIAAIGTSASESRTQVQILNDALQGTATTDLAEIDKKAADLQDKYDSLLTVMGDVFGKDMTGKIGEEMAALAIYREQVDRLRSSYGDNVDVIVSKLRELGLSSKVSQEQLIADMDRIKTEQGNTAIGTEDMVRLMATNYNILDNAIAVSTGGIVDSYQLMSDAALAAAGKAIVAHQEVLKAQGVKGYEYYGMAGLVRIGQLQGERFAKARAEAANSPKLASELGGGGAGGAATKRAGAQTAAGWITSFTAAISDLKAEDLLGKSAKWQQAGSNIARYLAKGLTSGDKNLNNVATYLSKTFGKTFIKQIQAELVKYRAALTVFDPITGKKQGKAFWDDRLQEIQSFKQSAYDALTSELDMTGHFGFIPTPAEVKQRLDAVVKRMNDFTSNIAALQAKGLDKDLAKAWLESGYEGAGNMVEGLKDATPETIKAISDEFRTTAQKAKTTADQQATKYYKIGETQVQKIIDGITSKTNATITRINTLMDQATAAAKAKLNWTKLGEDAMAAYNSGLGTGAGKIGSAISGLFKGADATAKAKGESLGKSTIDGYIAGLWKRKDPLAVAIRELIQGGIKAARIEQKGKSPSRVYAGIGQDSGAGYIMGVQAMESRAVGAVRHFMGKAAGVSAGTLGRPGFASRLGDGTAGGGGRLDASTFVKVYVGNREITDIVRTEAQRVDSVRARALYSGRRGGG